MTVISTPHGAALVLTINRPPVNALDLATIQTLDKTFAAVAAKPPKSGVVLTGAGNRAFSAGVDTRAFGGYTTDQRREMALAITAMTASLLAIPCPVVAAVNGHALGGGFVLMLGCDFRLAAASEAARFGLTEAQAGVPFPAGPAEIIRAELPPHCLRAWTLASVTVPATTLLEERLVDALVPFDVLLDQALRRAAALAVQPAFATVKKQVRGPLAARVAALAARGEEPFLDGFL